MAKPKALPKLPYTRYKFKSCGQIIEVAKVTDIYTFIYIESVTNLGCEISMSLELFDKNIRLQILEPIK